MGGGQTTLYGSGFRFVSIEKNSPAERAGIEVFFDYIVQIEDISLLDDAVDNHTPFFSTIQKFENEQVTLYVYSTRTRKPRYVYVIPAQWGGTGLLGGSVRYDSIENGFTQGIRVLETIPGSPAEVSGLTPMTDYLLCTKDWFFSDAEDLAEVGRASVGKPILISVYNSESKSIRNVSLTPKENWGGPGSVGCKIGSGYLHSIQALGISESEEESEGQTSPTTTEEKQSQPLSESQPPESGESSENSESFTPSDPPPPLPVASIPTEDKQESIAEEKQDPAAKTTPKSDGQTEAGDGVFYAKIQEQLQMSKRFSARDSTQPRSSDSSPANVDKAVFNETTSAARASDTAHNIASKSSPNHNPAEKSLPLRPGVVFTTKEISHYAE